MRVRVLAGGPRPAADAGDTAPVSQPAGVCEHLPDGHRRAVVGELGHDLANGVVERQLAVPREQQHRSRGELLGDRAGFENRLRRRWGRPARDRPCRSPSRARFCRRARPRRCNPASTRSIPRAHRRWQERRPARRPAAGPRRAIEIEDIPVLLSGLGVGPFHSGARALDGGHDLAGGRCPAVAGWSRRV